MNDTRQATDSLSRSQAFYDQLLPYRSQYTAINNAIPKGSTVLSAVEFPSLLDLHKFKVYTLDWPGANSLSPGIPIAEGGQAVATYLAVHHIGYILTQDPTSIINMYGKNAVNFGIAAAYFNYQNQGRVTQQWISDVSDLTVMHVSRRFKGSDVSLIKLTSHK